MLATHVAEPFDRPGWAYEEKYDGDRMLAYKEGARVRLLSRNGKDNTDRFAKIVAAIGKLRPATLLHTVAAVPVQHRLVETRQGEAEGVTMCSRQLDRLQGLAICPLRIAELPDRPCCE